MITSLITMASGSTSNVAGAFSSITSDMINGLFDGIIALLPMLLPALVGWIGIKKGIGFLMGTLRSA